MSQKAERGFWDTHDAIEILSCPDGYGHPFLLPLNGGRGLGGDVVNDAQLIDDAVKTGAIAVIDRYA